MLARKEGPWDGKEPGEHPRLWIFLPRDGRADPVITCTIQSRWVASNTLYCFQLPAAEAAGRPANHVLIRRPL